MEHHFTRKWADFRKVVISLQEDCGTFGYGKANELLKQCAPIDNKSQKAARILQNSLPLGREWLGKTSFEPPEPYDGKLSCTVLRGESSRKGADLPDKSPKQRLAAEHY